MAATSKISLFSMEWDRIEDILLGYTSEIARRVRKMQEDEEVANAVQSEQGCMSRTPTGSQLSPAAVLLVRTLTGHERRAWHEWAVENGYKHHFAVRTTHFDKQGVWYCDWCDTAYYAGTEVKNRTDYDMSGHPCGSWNACPTHVPGYEPCGKINLKYMPTVNAICLTNNDNLKCGKGVARRRRNKKIPKGPPKLRVVDIPFRETLVLDNPELVLD